MTEQNEGLNLDGIDLQTIIDWQQCGPWEELWIKSNIWDHMGAYGRLQAKYLYRRLNTQLYISEEDLESCADSARNQRYLEIRNTKVEFRNIEDFIGFFKKYYTNRIWDELMDLVYPDRRRTTGEKPVGPNTQNDKEKPSGFRKVRQPKKLSEIDEGSILPGRYSRKYDPYEKARENELLRLVINELKKFQKTVLAGTRQDKHYKVLVSISLNKKPLFGEVVDLVRYLSQTHGLQFNIAADLIARCCGSESNCRTHDNRLRKSWREFAVSSEFIKSLYHDKDKKEYQNE